MSETNLAILLSGSGTTLQNIADKITTGELSAKISLVIASNDHCFGIQRAKDLNLPLHIITRKSSPTLEDFSSRIASAIRQHNAQIVCMAGFLSLWTIPQDFLPPSPSSQSSALSPPHSPRPVLNIHPALLSLKDPSGHPRFGGKGMHGIHVHQAVLAAGEKTSGCTVHFADNSYDTGPIISERTCPVLSADTPEVLAARVFQQECIAYPDAIRWISEGVIEREPARAYMRKALAYITRSHKNQLQLLVFDHADHPDAGTQVPHGTMHVGENPDDALLREVHEETGLSNLTITNRLGIYEWKNPTTGVLFQRHVYHIHIEEPRNFWDWLETDGGNKSPDRAHRFVFRWLPLTTGIPLAGHQGDYLPVLLKSISAAI